MLIKNLFKTLLFIAILNISCSITGDIESGNHAFSIYVSSDSTGSVVDTGSHQVTESGEYELIADQPDIGYKFSYWKVDSGEENIKILDKDSVRTKVTSVKGNAVIRAVFTKEQLSLNVVTMPVFAADSIVLSSDADNDGKYDYGTNVTIRIFPRIGWKITGWKKLSAGVSDSVNIIIKNDISDTVILSPISVPANVICVKFDALQNGGGAIGSSWVDAYTDLNVALSVSEGKTVWVAKGTYKPHATLKDVPFTFKNNSRVIGGFAGTETSEIRDSLSNTTILSGLLTQTDTSLNIVNIPAGSDNVLISTFTIENSSGGTAGTSNGGISALNSNNLTVFRCVLKNNSPCAMEAGYKSTIRQCIFTANKGLVGAAIKTKADSLLVQHTVIAYNESQNNGAGIFISGNGGAAIINSTIVYNRSNSEGRSAGIWKGTSTDPIFMQNCIVWGNTVNGTTTIGTQINITDTTFRSNIQDTATGVGIGTKLVTTSDGWQGILQTDPQFVSTANLIGNDGKWFTDDDGLMLLRGSSPCIDAGRSIASHPTDWNSSVDIRGRIISKTGGKNLDMGAYDQ